MIRFAHVGILGAEERVQIEGDFADREAVRLGISRSRVIAQALSDIKADEEKRLTAEGYRFYTQEASQFAEASAVATGLQGASCVDV